MANKRRDEHINGKRTHVRDDIYKIPYRRKNGLPSNIYQFKTKCTVCGVVVFQNNSGYRKKNKPICSKKCLIILRAKPDGTRKYKRGTEGSGILVKAVAHPNKSKAGYVPEHRLVIEKKIGRFLKKEEVVHHINRLKDDNRLKNLVRLPNQTEHFLAHGSLNKCVAELIEKGYLAYDRKTNRYTTHSNTRSA